MKLTGTIFAFFVALMCMDAEAQPEQFNHDEAKVNPYALPALLKMQNGTEVSSPEMWMEKRRPELLELFRSEVYGRSPGRVVGTTAIVTKREEDALGGKAIRQEVTIRFGKNPRAPEMHLLIHSPKNATGAVPAFLGMSFRGNHTIHPDPGITIQSNAVPVKMSKDFERGAQQQQWNVERIIERGYALATIFYGDIEPDMADGWKQGVRGAQLEFEEGVFEPSQGERWGAISAWAWGLSRALDYLETDKLIDAKRVAVFGHSRLGKTALWAGAQDSRFAMTISNESGCGGAALNRRNFGETVRRINSSFPHWFCENFKKYNDREAELPIDQHQLIALIAPRPVYVASAAEDLWADPKGEFLGLLHAEPAYKLLGTDGLGITEMPAVNQSVQRRMGYHNRSGKHDVTEYDWEQYLAFADRHFKR
ncbi:MAG: acetylxylan esterase [Verrucomicrobiota bacterium]|nr:acetylxylan esterase [Verrucomicrobiota bacterium]